MTHQILASLSPITPDGCFLRVILGNRVSTQEHDDVSSTAISTSFLKDAADVVDDLENKIAEIVVRYDDVSHIVIDDITVMTYQPNPENGAAGMRNTKANKTWLIPGEWNTQMNCFYVAWAMLKNKKRFGGEYADWLEGKRSTYPEYKAAATEKKVGMRNAHANSCEPFRNAFVDNAQIDTIVAHSKPRPTVRVYGGQFQLLYDSFASVDCTVRPAMQTQNGITAGYSRSTCNSAAPVPCNNDHGSELDRRMRVAHAFSASMDVCSLSLSATHMDVPSCSQDEKGRSGTATQKRKRVRRMPGPVFEMQRSQNHYRPMIRWDDLDAALCERIQHALALKAKQPAAAIGGIGYLFSHC